MLGTTLAAAEQEREHGHHDEPLSGEQSNEPIVYAPGKKPEDVNTALTRTPSLGGPPLINDPTSRVYAGLHPSTQTQDRIEVVQFPNRGRHLVICGVLPHFQDGMFGYVRVLRRRH
jgi:hypothetical protein